MVCGMRLLDPSAPARLATLGLLLLPALAAPCLAAGQPSAPHHAGQAIAAQSGKAATSPAPPNELGRAESWTAYAFTGKDSKVCYLVGTPEKKEPAKLKRGRVDALVTHRPGEKAANVVNFDAGYAYKQDSDVDLDIDGRKFSLFTSKETAWTRDAATDKAVVEALAKSKRAVVKGTTANGVATTDTYSLGGFARALALIDKACGIKR